MSLKEGDTSSTCIFICQLNLWARKCQNVTLSSLSDIYQTHLSCESCFHHMFENWDSNVFSLSYHYSPVLIPDIISGIPKLRRVLLAYSIHNPETEYCQVGLILLVLTQRFAQKLCKYSSSSFASIIQATVQVLLQNIVLQVLSKQVLLQGFNRIAAIALLFMNEEDAFWALVYIVEVKIYRIALFLWCGIHIMDDYCWL